MLKLSGMMRYAVTETHKDFVPLDKEVSYITDFIELQKLRLDKGVRLEYEVIGSCADKQIPPLLLIPFIENAFKHGVNPDEDSSIQIHLRIQEESLELHVVNHKVSLGASVHEMMGIGIENTRNRLTYLYPGKHSLEIKETSSQYSVTLILQCK
jgi:LytS/YehU family sensor histidine kinase